MTTSGRNLPAWLDVSRETLERLIELESLVLKWTNAVNLVSKGSTADIWPRHILDSAQIFFLTDANARIWADLGSGGGFPALVLAILAKELPSSPEFVMVESDARKAAFLIQATRLLDLRAKVILRRIEEAAPIGADVLSARALAPLELLIGLAAPHLAGEARAIFPKGATYQQEIDTARQRWSFRCTAHISRTDPQAAILEVDQIELL